MAKFLNLMLCLFPFEIPLYADAGLRAICVGHPLLDSLASEKRAMIRDSALVALLPGSRGKEVRKIFPIMVAAAALLKSKRPALRFEASAASETLATEMASILGAHGRGPEFCAVTLRSAHDLMQRATTGMVCSGTATLESTFFGLPMVILYKVAWLTWAVGRRLVKIPWLGLPNVLAGREIVLEFLQDDAKPAAIAKEMLRLLEDPKAREAQQRAQAEVIASLGECGAAKRAAEAIVGAMHRDGK
jgi:lipid-A-disaccharide synthase